VFTKETAELNREIVGIEQTAEEIKSVFFLAYEYA
jgi:hypothetical protein